MKQMDNEVVKRERETIAACMTCPLCNKLFRDATTVIECLHTFCRKCIYKKFSDEELKCCPVCNCFLGGIPQEKLRPDHNLQNVRAVIFPCKRRKLEAHEVVSSATSPARRKERPVSSLVVNAPRVSSRTTMNGKRKKSMGRKAAKLWESDEKEEESEDGENDSDYVPSDGSDFNNFRWSRREREDVSVESGISLQAVVDSASARCERIGPVWFSLVASRDGDGDPSLAQIPANYLRIKDGHVPVAFIQKYIMRKLNLASEDEVEIKCLGKPVAPTFQINNLLDLWSQSTLAHKTPISVGSSAEDFVMELTYSRRVEDS